MSSKAKIYLYKEGNECTSLTGGYVESYSDTKAKTVTKTTNSFKILKDSDNYANGGLYTNNKIDLKYASKLVYNLTAYSFTYVSPDNTGTTLGTSSQANYNIANFVNTISLEPTMGKNTYQVTPTKSSFHVLVRQGGIAGCRLDAEVHEIYYEVDKDIVSINSQNDSSINFSCSNLDNLITITKVEVYINNHLSKTYTDNFDNIAYTIDSSLYGVGVNNIKIKVTYTQGDEIYETVEKVLPCFHNTGLPTSSSLKEFIDVQETITDTVEILKNNLKSNLESKSVNVSNSDKFSSLINKVCDISLGKKCASGTVTSGTSQKAFTFLNSTGSYNAFYSAKISDLGFTPSLVIAIYDEATNFGHLSMYYLVDNVKRFYCAGTVGYGTGYSSYTSVFKASNGLQCDSTGVTLPFAAKGAKYSWIAFE